MIPIRSAGSHFGLISTCIVRDLKLFLVKENVSELDLFNLKNIS